MKCDFTNWILIVRSWWSKLREKKCTELTKGDGKPDDKCGQKRGMGFHLVCAEIRPRKEAPKYPLNQSEISMDGWPASSKSLWCALLKGVWLSQKWRSSTELSLSTELWPVTKHRVGSPLFWQHPFGSTHLSFKTTTWKFVRHCGHTPLLLVVWYHQNDTSRMKYQVMVWEFFF